MTYPRTYRAFRRTLPPYPLSLTSVTETLPDSLGPRDIVIRIHAIALNYRDIAMLQEGKYPVPVEAGGIPASDCAAEVVAIGNEVAEFKVGDRVAPTPNIAQIKGDERDEETMAPGGDVPGYLREYAVVEEKALVKVPEYLSWEEATIPTCVGVAAWTALSGLRGIQDDSSVLLQGTGGVSMFALLLSLAAGIKPILTSSSDEKLENIKKLYPQAQGVNYKKHSDVAAEILRLTDGKGVDIVVNNIGPASIPSDLASLRKKFGTISLVGFLEGVQAEWGESTLFVTLLTRAARIQGILAGTRQDFKDLNQFLEEKKIRLDSIIDRTFTFEEAPAAFEYLQSGQHVGKVVLKL